MCGSQLPQCIHLLETDSGPSQILVYYYYGPKATCNKKGERVNDAPYCCSNAMPTKPLNITRVVSIMIVTTKCLVQMHSIHGVLTIERVCCVLVGVYAWDAHFFRR